MTTILTIIASLIVFFVGLIGFYALVTEMIENDGMQEVALQFIVTVLFFWAVLYLIIN